MDESVSAVLRNRKPLVDVNQAINLTVAGIIAHESGSKGGKFLKIPQFTDLDIR